MIIVKRSDGWWRFACGGVFVLIKMVLTKSKFYLEKDQTPPFLEPSASFNVSIGQIQAFKIALVSLRSTPRWGILAQSIAQSSRCVAGSISGGGRPLSPLLICSQVSILTRLACPQFLFCVNLEKYENTRSLGALRAPTSSWRPFGRSGRVTHATVQWWNSSHRFNNRHFATRSHLKKNRHNHHRL